MDALVGRIAIKQHGVVGRRQLLAAGLPRANIDALVRRDRLVRLSRGVYLVEGAPATPAADAVAAALRCGPDALVVGERMLAAVGVHAARRDGPFTVLTRPGRVVTGVDWRWRTNPRPVTADRATIDGIPSVTPARSLVEAAVDVDDATLERLVDGSRWTGRLDAAVALASRLPDHPGSRRLFASGLVSQGAPESPPERAAAVLLVDMGAELQVWVTPSCRVDFFFREEGLVVEYDGKATHEGPVGEGRDGSRDAALRSLGLAIEHITAADLLDLDGMRRRITAILTALGRRPHALR